MYQKLDRNAYFQLLLQSILVSIILWGIIIVCYLVFPDFYQEYSHTINFGLLLFAIFTVVETAISPVYFYRRYRYLVDEDRVESISGVYFTTHHVVPLERIKQLTINRGPIDKLMKLSNLTIFTSGGSITIKYLPTEVAENIATKLYQKINDIAIAERGGENLE